MYKNLTLYNNISINQKLNVNKCIQYDTSCVPLIITHRDRH